MTGLFVDLITSSGKGCRGLRGPGQQNSRVPPDTSPVAYARAEHETATTRPQPTAKRVKKSDCIVLIVSEVEQMRCDRSLKLDDVIPGYTLVVLGEGVLGHGLD